MGHSIPLFRDFGKASDLVERPKECVNRLSSPYRGAQSPIIYQYVGHWLGNTLVLSVIKFQMCGNFSMNVLDSSSLLNYKI